MKKILTILGCFILLAATSCTKQYVTPGQTNQTVYADLTTTNWTLFTDNGGSKSYAATINVPAINGNFVQSGGIIVAISYDGGNTYEQLPETYNGIAYSYTYNAGNPGNVTLYAQSSDGITPEQPTLPIHVKIILVDSN